MHIGTNQRIGGLAMRYGLRSQLAPLDCTSSRRSTVMRALPRATGVTTGYQRDSSSKRPMSSVTLAARARPPVEAAATVDAEERAHSRLENDRTVFHSSHRPLTTGHSISARGPIPSAAACSRQSVAAGPVPSRTTSRAWPWSRRRRGSPDVSNGVSAAAALRPAAGEAAPAGIAPHEPTQWEIRVPLASAWCGSTARSPASLTATTRASSPNAFCRSSEAEEDSLPRGFDEAAFVAHGRRTLGEPRQLTSTPIDSRNAAPLSFAQSTCCLSPNDWMLSQTLQEGLDHHIIAQPNQRRE